MLTGPSWPLRPRGQAGEAASLEVEGPLSEAAQAELLELCEEQFAHLEKVRKLRSNLLLFLEVSLCCET